MLLGCGEERVPEHPGIDRPALEGGTRIRRRQVDRLDLAVRDAGLLQLAHQQVMHVRALVQRHALAAQFRHRTYRRALGHDDGLGHRRRRLIADVDQLRPRGLRKDRRRLADGAEIDGTDVQPLKQLRPGGELGPFDGDALRRQAFFQRAARLQQRQRAVFLVTDAQHLGVDVLRLRFGAAGQ